MEPRYIADYGVKKWHVMDRSKPVGTGFIMNIVGKDLLQKK